jgi:hypothetical protein
MNGRVWVVDGKQLNAYNAIYRTKRDKPKLMFILCLYIWRWNREKNVSTEKKTAQPGAWVP